MVNETDGMVMMHQDASSYALVIERYEARDEARRKYLKEQQLKKLEERNHKQGEGRSVSDDDEEAALNVDEAKVDESKQMDFAKVEKRVRTIGGGSTGTVRYIFLFFAPCFPSFLVHFSFFIFFLSCFSSFLPSFLKGYFSTFPVFFICQLRTIFFYFRNLRIREDTAKYLLNLDVNSAHYDPKTRSMREDPLPDADPNEKFYGVSVFGFVSNSLRSFYFVLTRIHFTCCHAV